MQMLPGPADVAERAAEVIAEQARESVAARGEFRIALSGGSTPGLMLAALAERDDMPWRATDIFQVDERCAPDGHEDRNDTMLREVLLGAVTPGGYFPMPGAAQNLDEGAASYAEQIQSLLGHPPVFDLIHLGLGSDAHTASLVPGDPVIDVVDRSVAVTGEYQGRRRLTLTRPVLDRARALLWVVAGASKAEALQQLLFADGSVPAGMIANEHAIVLFDDAAQTGG